mmetsp:Transcript_96284/g.274290  ORF Transcript_96284/g.274290 Transcript_96284/m.274290 type:complete len:930 (-) Transcript_96284:52-2841(-)
MADDGIDGGVVPQEGEYEMGMPQEGEYAEGEGEMPMGPGGEDEEEEFDDEEHPDDVVRNFGQHPMMENIQKALFSQLEREHERVLLEKREAEAELKMISDKREGVGVDLYSNQQQLARLQMALENLHNNFHTLRDARAQEESVLDESKSRHASLKGAYAERQKSLLKTQAELDALNETIHQVERYNEEMKNEIAVTRRATYKAETSVVELEKQKQGQDLYIDGLNEQRKQLQEQVALHESQFGNQADQTEEAKKILAETASEMELIAFEKKQLMQQWKTSLINLTKRDEAVAAATTSTQEASMQIRDLETEIEGTKRDIGTAQTQNETLVAMRERLGKEDVTLDEQIMKISNERDELAERYEMLQRSMAQTDDEEKKVDSVTTAITAKVETANQNIQVVVRERQKVEASILAKNGERLTVNKAVKNYMKAAAAMTNAAHDKEIEAAHLENELSRIRVDTLNTDAHNVQLREMMEKQLTELKDKDKLIEKYQLEIRQRNDEIEKKMYRVDRLNRKYELLVDGQEDVEHMGPLEATISALRKEIVTVNEAATKLQREWLADQTQLVSTSSETEEKLEKNTELRARISILTEKKLRLNKDIGSHEAEVKRLDHMIQNMHKDMQRLNELIGKNTELQGELSQTNSVMEMEFVNELKELEHVSVQLEEKVTAIKSAKAGLLDDIMETERQLLLWEKKIQLEKETQAALDPEVGMQEIHAMEKEIHRMKLRFTTLKSEQDRMVKEMERAVHKREAIALRFKGKSGAAKNATKAGKAGGAPGKKELTKAQLTKKLGGLKRSIKDTAQTTAEYSAAIAERQAQINSMTAELEGSTAQYGDLEEKLNNLQVAINTQLYDKQRQAETHAKRQRMLRRYQSLEQGRRKPVAESEMPLVERQLAEVNADKAKVKNLINAMREKFDHLDEVLGRVLQLAEDE